jgi:hypothetical protein
MREDYQEQLDKMFPEGYVIVYTTQTYARVNMYNPNLIENLYRINFMLTNKDDINF